MFTGIVEERGRVRTAGPRLVVECRTVSGDAQAGASVAVNGVCLTVVELGRGTLAFDLTPETLERSTLGSLAPGDPVNLERPITLLTRLGGHMVQGHVDGVGTVEAVKTDGNAARMRVAPPPGLARYLTEKGSVAVDGVSLTVAGVQNGTFEVALIPHTMAITTLGQRNAGDHVNVEVDVLAKYVEGLLGRSR